MRLGRIPYINCFPVYGGVDRGGVPMRATLVDGVPTTLNRMMAEGTLDLSVVSAVEYARDSERYLLLPDLAISCDGPVRSVMLFSHEPAQALHGKRVLVSRSSMTSVHLLELLFEHVWRARPEFVPGDAEADSLGRDGAAGVAARLGACRRTTAPGSSLTRCRRSRGSRDRSTRRGRFGGLSWRAPVGPISRSGPRRQERKNHREECAERVALEENILNNPTGLKNLEGRDDH